jgi:hypothetical protein
LLQTNDLIFIEIAPKKENGSQIHRKDLGIDLSETKFELT